MTMINEINFRPTAYRTALRTFLGLKGLSSFSIWKFLKDSQWWSNEQIRLYQDEQLRKLIDHSYAHVAYYRNLMKQNGLRPSDFQSTSDLVKLPILTKNDVRAHWQELVADNRDTGKISLRRTGGSTGQPLNVMTDYTSGSWEAASYYRGLGFSGYQPGEKMVVLFGGSLGLRPQTFVNELKKRFAGEVFLSALEINRDNIEDHVARINHGGAKFIRGYTSAMFLLAKYAEEKGLQLSLLAAFPTAETLHEYERRCFERVFHTEVFNQYGCGECNSIAFECPSHNVLHASDENVLIECLNEYEPVKERIGLLTITPLHNYAFPLIRYQNGDVVSITDTKCVCGRGLSSITKVYGRENDMLVTKDGRLITASFLPSFCVNHSFEGVQQFQIIQKSQDIMHLIVVKTSDFREGNLMTLRKTFRQYLGEIEIVVKYVNNIPKTEAGKHKYVINEMDIKSMLIGNEP